MGLAGLRGRIEEDAAARVSVSLVKNQDRKAGLRKAVELLGEIDFRGKDVCLKCNFNSADAFPATTHPDALSTIVQILRERMCGKILLVERSGMGTASEIWERLGIRKLAKELEIVLMPLEDLPATEWRKENLPGSHWQRGVEAPKLLNGGTCVVQICNLKTHRFGGQFSASLKNSIGLIAKNSQTGSYYNYMKELHSSSEQCQMIAEVNQIYAPGLVVMDAMQCFVEGGPESGETADAQVAAASRDRVALDAVGLALLRHNGARPPLNQMAIFEQAQIKRAVELKLGVQSAKEIRLLTDDEESRVLATQLDALLSEAPTEEGRLPAGNRGHDA